MATKQKVLLLNVNLIINSFSLVSQLLNYFNHIDEFDYNLGTSPMMWRKLDLNSTAEKHFATVKASCIYNGGVTSTISKRFQVQFPYY